MLICLDYDKTYDADPASWNWFIAFMTLQGHEVILATYRDDRYDKTRLLDTLAEVIPVYYTRGVAKRWYLEQFAPKEHSKVDIWIDDRPEAILNNSTFSRGQLAQWRKDNEGVFDRESKE